MGRPLLLLLAATAILAAACSSSSSTPANGAPIGAPGEDGGGGDDTANGGDAGKNDGATPDGDAPLGKTSSSGSADGVLVNAVSAFAYYDTIFTDGKSDTRGVWIVLSDKLNTCATQHYANSTYLYLTIVGEPVAAQTFPLRDPASYPVSEGDPVAASVELSDSQCHSAAGEDSAKSGSIVITTSTKTHVAGTFTVQFKSGIVTGTFDSPVCGAPPAPVNGTCPP